MYIVGNYVPVTKRTVCYIVAGVLINDAGQILMMQEAKYSCHGTWYLPAGRVERGESLQVISLFLQIFRHPDQGKFSFPDTCAQFLAKRDECLGS